MVVNEKLNYVVNMKNKYIYLQNNIFTTISDLRDLSDILIFSTRMC